MISLLVDEGELEAADALAENLDMSRSELFRRAVAYFVEAAERVEPPTHRDTVRHLRQRWEQSCAELERVVGEARAAIRRRP